ncbi:hypothetical protein HK103_001251 [Boothiomyces macroporosus]|uniref:Ribosomal protein L1 n=1 Tax=Boothiomyces macroporosus TaxID=261099 RepID=A0AAD5UM75_9FUNG|nr:hypothetical protein HK103_001251 [Boothiomyces macroporosus]
METPDVDRKQIEKAVKALFKWSAKQEKQNDLIEKQDKFWLVVTTKKMPDRKRVKPEGVLISNSLYNDKEICLFTKDPQKDYKEKLSSEGVENVKVIGLSKLKAKYKPYEAKRELAASYDLFVTDNRIVEFLPKMLGKTFFQKKNSIYVATTEMTQEQCVENIVDVWNELDKIPGKWDNILSINLKLTESISLPIYATLPEPDE